MLHQSTTNYLHQDWPQAYIECLELPPFRQLESQFQLAPLPSFPSLTALSRLSNSSHNTVFVDQFECDASGLYYEQFIDRYNAVPTRQGNWHDLYNALMWHQFPVTKRIMNKMHVADIAQHGLHPRTRKRDLLTHFDECGVILAVTDDSMTSMLANHRWNDAFVTNQQAWGTNAKPFIIGHALYEMLMQPYIGLTAKWLAVKVDDAFFDAQYIDQLFWLDNKVSKMLEEQAFWKDKKPFKPLPILGIPGWWTDQSPAFYANQDYFRARRISPKTPRKEPR